MRLVLFLLALVAVAPTAALAQGGGLTRVHFARGRSEATIPGRMGARDIASDYTLAAKKGQRMTVRLRSAPPGARLTVIGPDVYLANADAVSEWSGRLPKSGEYVFRVSAARPAAFVYTLQIKISALPPAAPSRRLLAPADAALTGSYDRGGYGDIDVQALPGGRVHFRLTAFGHISSPGGPSDGEADGTLTLHGGVGVYVAPKDDGEGGGRLLLRFTPRRVIVTQEGASWDLGFGMGVSAAGVYKKNSSRPPKFDPMP